MLLNVYVCGDQSLTERILVFKYTHSVASCPSRVIYPLWYEGFESTGLPWLVCKAHDSMASTMEKVLKAGATYYDPINTLISQQGHTAAIATY